jgi:hypothetical protein
MSQKEDLTKIWKIIQTAPASEREEIIKTLKPEVIVALRSFSNPYKKPVYAGNQERLLAFSIINILEDYSCRFAMTSIIGFIYRMLDEYEPEERENYVSENDAKFAIPFNMAVKKMRREKPEMLLLEEMKQVNATVEATKNYGDKNNAMYQEYRSAARRIFVIRAKLLKNSLYWTREDYNLIKERHASLEKEIKNRTSNLENMHKEVAAIQAKLDKRKQYDTDKLQGKSEIPEGMDITDVRRKISDYIVQIENKNKLIVKETADLVEQESELAARKVQVEAYVQNLSALNARFEELKSEFLKRTGATRTKKRSVKTELDLLEVDKYELTEEDYDTIAESIKAELGITVTAEEYTIQMQDRIQSFMDQFFKYNPDNHVRSAYAPNYDDPHRTPLERTSVEDEKDKKYERTMIPPSDTFFRIRRYMENNYECLRQATDDIYCEKSDFETAIAPLEVFTGPDARENFDKFKRKYADEFDSEVYCAKFNQWNLLASWEQNREVRDFYTEKTEIVKRIIDRHKEDQRTGASLTKQRIRKEKAKNEKKEGPLDPAFANVRKELKTNVELERHGAKHVNDLRLDEKNIPRDTDESGKNEVEVGVHVIKPHMGSKRRYVPRGEGEQWKFHIPAEKMPEGSVDVYTGADFQKKSEEELKNMTV